MTATGPWSSWRASCSWCCCTGSEIDRSAGAAGVGAGVARAGAAGTGLEDFDAILQELDKQGAIEENMMFLDRSTSLGIDNMLAAQNSYGAGGTSFGVFENSEQIHGEEGRY